MKPISIILIVLMLVASCLSFTSIGVTPYNYEILEFEHQTFDYYHAGNSWLFIFFPGGIGYNDRIEGCQGTIFDNHTCSPHPRGDEWLARLFLENNIDFLEPHTYKFSVTDQGKWIVYMIQSMKPKYQTIVFGGFSGGGAVAATIPIWHKEALKNILNATAIYEGPTTWGSSSTTNSAPRASESFTKTFLAYGIRDQVVPLSNGVIYLKNMKNEVPKLFVTYDVKHDGIIIVYSIGALFSFLGKNPPPKIETQVVTYIHETTITEPFTTTFVETTQSTTTETTTKTSTISTIIEILVPSWHDIEIGLLILTWVISFFIVTRYQSRRYKNSQSEKPPNKI